MQVNVLKRNAQDLFSSPGFLLQTFTVDQGLARGPEEGPSTSGSGPPPHGLDLAKITQTYNALLQVRLASMYCAANVVFHLQVSTPRW